MSPVCLMIFSILAGLLGVGITIVAGLFTSHYFSEWKKQSEPQSGLISGRIIDENLDYIMIFGGATTTQIKGDNLKKGIDITDISPVKIEGVTFPIKLYEENKSIMVDASILDASNKIICQIVKNNWTVHPKGYQLNNSINALEIIDEKHMPVLQIYLQEPNKIYIGGAFFNKNGKRWNFLLSGITDMDIEPQTLFKYPSSQYLGQLNDNSPFLNLKKISHEIQKYRDIIKKLSEPELKKIVINTVNQLREFLYNAKIDSIQLSSEQQQQYRLEENENVKKNFFKIHTQENINRKRKFDIEYDSQFAAKSLAFRNELTFRLKKKYKKIETPIEYELPGYYHKEIVSDNLEYLTKMLDIHNLSTQQICDKAFKLVSDLRAFNSYVNDERDKTSLERNNEMQSAKSKTEKDMVWSKHGREDSKLSLRQSFDYNSKYKIDAILMKQLLPSRPYKNKKDMEDRLFERPMIPMELNELAEYIELRSIYLKEGYGNMSNEELNTIASDFINNKLIKFTNNIKKERDNFYKNLKNTELRTNLSPEDFNRLIKSIDYTEFIKKYNFEYNNTLRPHTIILRDEISHRIGELHEDKKIYGRYERARIPNDLDEIINNLEQLAKKL